MNAFCWTVRRGAQRRLQAQNRAAARSTKEVEDGKHTSGGVVIAVKRRVASVVDTAEGKVEGLEENE